MADQTFAVQSGFYDSINLDRTYSAEDMNRPYKRVITNGVFATPQGTPSTDLQVTAYSGMTIHVAAGDGLFGDKWFSNPSIIAITVPSNTNLVSRIDSVIVQIDKRQTGRVGNIVYRTGTPASNPVAPSINTDSQVIEYRVANIQVLPSTTVIVQSYITDLRGSSECPWITSLIKQVDTSVLFDQWMYAYQSFYDASTADFAAYFNIQRNAWEAFLESLTEDLTVSMNVVTLTNSYVSAGTTTTVPIGIASFDKSTDVLLVFVNGLLIQPGERYSINSAGTEITLTNAISGGQTVNFVALKSVVSGDISSTVSLIQALDAKLDAYMTDSGWQTFGLQNTASVFNGQTPAFRKAGQIVHLRGMFKGVTSTGTAICTLPAGFRPAMAHVFTSSVIGGTSVSATVALQIGTDGVVKILATSGTINALSGISLATDFVLG